MRYGVICATSVIAFGILALTIVSVYDYRITDVLGRNQVFLNLLRVLLDEVTRNIDNFLRIAVCPNNLEKRSISHLLPEFREQRNV